jgi:hypothetical protein
VGRINSTDRGMDSAVKFNHTRMCRVGRLVERIIAWSYVRIE